MCHYGSAVLLVLASVGSPAGSASDPKAYIIEPPDVLRLDVTGLPKKAQPVSGEFVVRPDGSIWLSAYGSVTITGLTLDEAREAITKLLSSHAKKKGRVEVRVEVVAYNSKVFYIIGTGKDGDQVHRFPTIPGETVVGAILKIDGMSAAAAKGYVWVINPSSRKVREVNWRAITQQGQSATNYRLEAGDRVHVSSSPHK
jgi:polysaccharide export outer membrane protein